MLCPNCGKKIRENKGLAAMFYDGYCTTCKKNVKTGVPDPDEMTCNPDICPNCEYIGQGDSYCSILGEIVLSEWEPTTYFKGIGCPYNE